MARPAITDDPAVTPMGTSLGRSENLRVRHGNFAAARTAIIRALGLLLGLLGCLQQGHAQDDNSGEFQPLIDVVNVKYGKAAPAPGASNVLAEAPNVEFANHAADSRVRDEALPVPTEKPLPLLKLVLTLGLILITIYMARSTLKEQGVPSLSRVSALFLGNRPKSGSAGRASIMRSGIQRFRQSFSGKPDKKS